jgi:thiamine-phosphate pyrophosphorylase
MALSKILNWFKGGQVASDDDAEKSATNASRDGDATERDTAGDDAGGGSENDAGAGQSDRRDRGERGEGRPRRRRSSRRRDCGDGEGDTGSDAPLVISPRVVTEGELFSVVISRPGDIENEHDIVEALFDAGLSRFHLRKHDWPASDIRRWVEALQKKYYDRLVIHAQPNIVREFHLAGLHLRSNFHRPRHWPEEIPVSNSCHSFRNLCEFARGSSYATLGPIFPSVSKRGYEPQRTPEEYEQTVAQWKAEPNSCPLLALGGLTEDNIGRAREMGFAGFAVVGSVWDAPDPVEGFKRMVAGWSK